MTRRKTIKPDGAPVLSETERRVAEQSARLREVRKALKKVQDSIAQLAAQKENIAILEAYLAGEWKDDYEADERGEISKSVARDVLGQDTLYNLLEDIETLQI